MSSAPHSSSQAAQEPPDDPGSPTIEELLPTGSRVVIRYQFSRTIATGTVIGYDEGLVDIGSPESGPGPVMETDLIVVETDDGRTIRVEPGQLEPDEDVVA